MSYRDEPAATEIRLDGLSDDDGGEVAFQGQGEAHRRRGGGSKAAAARKRKWKERRKKVGVTCSDVICKKSVRYRFGYACAVAAVLALVCSVPHTTLWNGDGSANGGAFFSFMFVIAIMLGFYWAVQNSDPGFLTGIINPDDAVEWSTDAFRAHKWKSEWGDEDDGTWDSGSKKIMEAMEMFRDEEEDSEDDSDSEDDNIEAGGKRKKKKKKKKEKDSKKNGKAEKGSGGEDLGGASVPPMLESDGINLLEYEQDPSGPPVCSRLRIDTKHPDLPYRAIYCKQERRWIAMFDHYCGVLGTPIGEKNHSRFWWYLFVQLAALCYAVGIVHSGINHNIRYDLWYDYNAHALWTAIVLYLIVLFVGSLWLFHTWLAATNTTSYEFMRNSKIDYLQGTRDFDLPYSHGCKDNLRMFCCNDGMLAWLRGYTWEPVQWGKPGKFKTDGEWTENIWQNKHWSCC
jgi:hypothetical protein